MEKENVHQLVLIEWLDITSNEQPWMDEEEVKKLIPLSIVTVGRLIEENDSSITVAASWGEDDGELFWGNVNCIPRGVIKSVRLLPMPEDSVCSPAAGKRDDGSAYLE